MIQDNEVIRATLRALATKWQQKVGYSRYQGDWEQSEILQTTSAIQNSLSHGFKYRVGMTIIRYRILEIVLCRSHCAQLPIFSVLSIHFCDLGKIKMSYVYWHWPVDIWHFSSIWQENMNCNRKLYNGIEIWYN